MGRAIMILGVPALLLALAACGDAGESTPDAPQPQTTQDQTSTGNGGETVTGDSYLLKIENMT